MQEFNGTHTIMDPLKKTDSKKVVHKYIIIIENVCGRLLIILEMRRVCS